MIVCIQRILQGSVTVDGEVKGKAGRGLYVLVGVENGDTEKTCAQLAEKLCSLRIFPDEKDRMTNSITDINGEMLIVSQFTLAADTSKGNRPDFSNAEKPERAEYLYNMFVNKVRSVIGADRVGTGVFGAYMVIDVVNDGPVTINIKR